MPADNLKAVFFAECEGLLEALGEGLSTLETGEADEECLHAIFRAVHSMKGSAGAFGFETLQAFSHHYETVLDLIRSDKLAVTSDLAHTLLRASDVLANLVDLAQNDAPGRPEAMDDILAALIALSEQSTGRQGFHIRFDPGPDFFRNGHDFSRLISELETIGQVECRVDPGQLPDITEFYSDTCYLTWDIEIETEASEERVLESFLFLEEFCEISPLSKHAGAAIGHPPAAKPAEAVAAGASDPATPGATGPVPAKSGATAVSSHSMLRVNPERVDKLINTVGELIINQAVISQRLAELGVGSDADLMADLDEFQHLARDIQEGVMAIRAQPVKPLFQRMQRILRDAVDSLDKDVQLVIEGENTEIDKTLVERLADPLTHMIRNAVDHGIEASDLRAWSGKPARGTIKLSAAHRSGQVQIEISDDGAGVNRAKVLAKAVEKGLVPADAKLSDNEIDNLLFMPGFSTASEVTNMSGRGVGMDVVKTAIADMGGRVAITSAEGMGTTITISLPLTLAVTDGMIVHVAGETMVVPLASIVETISPASSDIKPLGCGGRLLKIRGTYVPILALSDMLNLSPQDQPQRGGVFVLVRSEHDELVALAVDDISDQRQVVIKGLEGNYGAVPGISAATILGDGRVALIVDTEAILAQAHQGRAKAA